MVFYYCPKCNKEFNKSTNLMSHLNRKRPCTFLNEYKAPKSTEIAPKSTDLAPKSTDLAPKSTDSLSEKIEKSFSLINEKMIDNNNLNIQEILLNDIDKLANKNIKIKLGDTTCIYCESSFTRHSSLQRHLKERCKSKKYYDELEKIKLKFERVISNNEHLLKENEELKKQINTNNSQIITTNNNKNSNNTTNNINNGNITNNNLNVQLVRFGNENIDDLDIKEAFKVYLRSTGGNIVSNMLKFVNLNEKYPQNHNICMSDLSRELVKIFNGKQFIVKKFKDAKSDILGKAIVTTYKIVDKIENDEKLKKTPNDKSKMKINKVSLKLINGASAEDIVREEIRETEKLLKDDDILLIADNSEEKEIEYESYNKEEREFTSEEINRIKHLENKQQGLQEITLERLKEELYNGKCLVICD
jgi:hypothetical protein